jgi:hypothetical protein
MYLGNQKAVDEILTGICAEQVQCGMILMAAHMQNLEAPAKGQVKTGPLNISENKMDAMIAEKALEYLNARKDQYRTIKRGKSLAHGAKVDRE